MCGYAGEGAPASAEDLIVQFESAMEKCSPEVTVVKIYTSGSFLDSEEMPPEARVEILRRLENAGIEKLIIETRPVYVTPAGVEECLSHLQTEFAMGLESANDLKREHLIRKGFLFQDFVLASEMVHGLGGGVKAYLLLKPPFLTEGQALRDAISSARTARPYADIISLNLCNVQRNTVVERMWEKGEYRPPWLWSALEAIKSSPGPIICDPVGAGTRRGPHNCGQCDAALAEAIRKHDLTQDARPFDDLHCQCKEAWQKLMELEEQSFGTPLC